MVKGFPDDLVLTPISRWPTTLPDASIAAVLDTPMADRIAPHQRAGHPRVSIVIVTHNGLVFTRLCLETLLGAQTASEFEVVVVDNASNDGTVEYLLDLRERDRRVRVERNPINAGFGEATNLGVAVSAGEIVVLLNNDTVPAADWLDRLVDHLQDPAIGIVGAVTNRAGNEAEIEVTYRTYGEFRQCAADYARAHAGDVFDIRTVIMFCAALRRETWQRVGPLDERFEIGLFEDDDFSMRVRDAGLRTVCAEDVFVHHMGQASIGRLAATGDYGRLFDRNRSRWEGKWGQPWQPYTKRHKADYAELVTRVRELVCRAVPSGSTVAVVSRGDEDLLQLNGRRAWHFPQAEDGSFAGYYPADSGACIAELERVRARGAQYLVIPRSSEWWLNHYAGFAAYLEVQYGAQPEGESPAIIVPLRPAAEAGAR